jgi:hypothetical protein
MRKEMTRGRDDAETRGRNDAGSPHPPFGRPLPEGEGRGEGSTTPPPTPTTQHPAPRTLLPILLRLWRILLPALWTGLALALLAACDYILFRPAIQDGQIYSRSDTVTYYFPIANRLIDVLREGRLILWTRHLFGGFPLFADGEAGMLYPPHLFAYLFLPGQDALIWSRVLRHLLSALFCFAYLRTLRISRFGAVIGAITFAYGSFMVTQMHHSNVANTAIWLPLTLAFIEMALQNVRRWRWIYAGAASASVGVQALGLHIQPLLMSGLFLAIYLPFRVMLCPIAWPEGWGRRTSSSSGRAPKFAATVWRVGRGAGGALFRLRGPLSRVVRGGMLRLSLLWIEFSAALRLLLLGPDLFGRVGDGSGAVTSKSLGQDEAKSRKAILPAVFVSWWSGHPWVEGSIRAAGGLLCAALRLVARMIGAVVRLAARFVVAAFHRGILALLLGVGIPSIAFGLAAVQILPLVELGTFSFRGPGVNYQFATSYSLPIQNLIDLVFPYFFRYTNRYYWSLWSEWETTVYVGIAGLVLASIALIFVRRRLVLFFAAFATLSILLAFGSYSPYQLLDPLRQLPGFSSLRVPGRFSMLFTFSVAVLAAYGADWLCTTLRPDGRATQRRWWTRVSKSVGVNGFAIYLVGLLASMSFVVWWLLSFRIWIEKEPWAARQFVESSYLSLRSDKPWLTSDMVLSFLNYSLDPTNPKTTISLALMLATFLLLFCWFAFRRVWRLWASLLVLLVAADMMIFSLDFHPTVHINQLSNPDSAARWLMDQNADGSSRVYTRKDVRKTEANKLLPFQVADITGYSSLETQRHQEYMGKLAEFELGLLDLYNVRFVVMPKRVTALPSYEFTSYHPNRPLADGPANSRSANVTYYMNPPVRADSVSLISNLRSATDIPQDADVADVVVVDTNGERVTLKLKAGRDTAEWAWDRPDVKPHMAHQQAKVADRVWSADPAGNRYQAYLYYGRLPLDKTRTVAKVEFHYTYPKGAARLYGMMLWENPNSAHQVVGRDRFIPRYEDDEVQILENPAMLPRTYLVPTARVVRRGDVMDTMASGDFDPRRIVLLESDGKDFNLFRDTGIANAAEIDRWLKGNPSTVPGSASIVSDKSTEVVIQAESDRDCMLFLADSYYPGWRALVDGQEAQVYRANYLFRAIQLPKGKHEVRFVFEPASFDLGKDISLYTLGVLLVVWTGLLSAPLPGILWRWLRRPRRR